MVGFDLYSAVATTRRHNLPTSDSGAFTDWTAAATTTTTSSRATEDLSLGFNAGPAVVHGGLGSASAGAPSWPPGSTVRYGLPSAAEMSMVGLRDVYLVAPAYHHHHQNVGLVTGSDQINSNAAATSLGVGVIPLLTTAPTQNVEDTDINFLGNSRRWHNNDSSNNQTEYLHFKNSHHQVTVASSSKNSGSGSGGTATCQDCGNQAKKECKQRRCRTCCKSRGFDCSTHVKSTWVSAARRRERHVIPAGNPTAGSSPSTSSGTKKPRIAGSQQQATSHTSTSNTPPQSLDTSSSRQEGGGSRKAWPGQVKAAAVFKCVRVTAMEDGDDEYAYQAVVKIGGHIFKGFLYDQGLEPKEGFPNMSDLHLGGGGNSHNEVSASQPILDPPNVYGGGGSGAGFYG
ncbi:unnamed protein product [Eruca vesicaria subsp. sativa]|uniref:Uncharacterized protein n=1 Tax=Eruca vesicaria subsp. sativa TaxID=29727 RepID=A0ABC8JA26_ERUVS|nr:unnamed protein product [Eruca vesicaria subsp. sativa]